MAASAPVLASAPTVRTDLGRIPMRRPGDGAPPPASTFYPTIARPGGAPGGIGAVPSGTPAVPPSQTGRYTRQAVPPAAPPPSYARPAQSSPSQGVPSTYGGPTAVQPATRAAPPAANPNSIGNVATPGSTSAMRSDQRTDQRPSSRPAPQTATAVAVPPAQSYAAPQSNNVMRPSASPAQSYAAPQAQANPATRSQSRPPPPVQAQGLQAPAAPVVRSAPVPPAAAPVHTAPPPAPAQQAAPPASQDGGNLVRKSDRGAPSGQSGDRPGR
jgi:hypothetical protein